MKTKKSVTILVVCLAIIWLPVVAFTFGQSEPETVLTEAEKVMGSGDTAFSSEAVGDQWVFGPKVGFSYGFYTVEEFTDLINKIPFFIADSYSPFLTNFGVSLEQRILLGTTESHFAFQEILILSGIDQSIVLPSLAVLVGFRAKSGFEFGIGPIIGISGFSVLYAVGWTISFQGVYCPIDVIFVPDVKTGRHLIAIYSGFNFTL